MTSDEGLKDEVTQIGVELSSLISSVMLFTCHVVVTAWLNSAAASVRFEPLKGAGGKET